VHPAGRLALILQFEPLVDTSISNDERAQFDGALTHIVRTCYILVADIYKQIVAKILDVNVENLTGPARIFSTALASLTLPGSFPNSHKAEGIHLGPKVGVACEVSFCYFNL